LTFKLWGGSWDNEWSTKDCLKACAGTTCEEFCAEDTNEIRDKMSSAAVGVMSFEAQSDATLLTFWSEVCNDIDDVVVSAIE